MLANRLSADPANRVLLLEAGEDTPPGAVPPEILDSFPMPLFFGDKYIWPGLVATINRRADGQANTRLYEQGRVMGGSSSINVQSANRGLPRDYDEWEQLGATGWGWYDVLPYFRRLERDLDFGGPLHGQDGPVPIRRILPQHWPPFAHAVAACFDSSDCPRLLDQNAQFEDGIFPPAFSNINDQRVSAASAYLDPATRSRRNLTISAASRVTSLFLSGTKAKGVELERTDGTIGRIGARRVVITAGALQSPAILMRAGIGPAAPLRSLGINVFIERRGVGANLRDHPALTFCQYLRPELRLPVDFRRSSLVALRYSSGMEGGSLSDMYITASARAAWHALGERLGLYFLWCNRPYSMGSLRLTSPDPKAYPQIDLNLLSDPRDLRRLAAGVRSLGRLVISPDVSDNPDDLFPATFSPIIKRVSEFSDRHKRLAELLARIVDAPTLFRRIILRSFMLGGSSLGKLLANEARLEEFVRNNVFGVWHASGTCRMGRESDPDAVVDPGGKVIGSENIWIADASVMPRLPTANTNIPTIMIAEKISDGLLRA
ncbi:MAG: GMC family oxidoreductase N-terminal domain-containing protein [Acetobacteraceae bacterium]|nr:GMC family oxidoreductase N-terminal domain-containing protein [Acetobacteraceae bacterium]